MLSDHDYEQVGRWLDGEPVALTPTQRELAQRVLADEAAMGPQLDVGVPAAVLRRLAAPRVRPAPRRARLPRWVGAAAAAAAILLAAILWKPIAGPARPASQAVADLETVFGGTDVLSLADSNRQEDLPDVQTTDLTVLASLDAEQTLEAFFGAQAEANGG